MHETERHRVIIAAVQSRPVITVAELCEITGSSEATIRRDIGALDVQGKLRRVRGGAEAINPPAQGELMGRPFSVNETLNIKQKRAIARAAAEMCRDGEPIIINGGTTTYQMVHFLTGKRVSVFTNSFAIAEFLIHNSRCSVVIPGGTVYREQNVILSPFGGVVASHFYAKRMFIGCQGIGPHGLMEADPMVVQSELALIGQADEVIVLADSTKFSGRSSLILCGLDRISAVITDSGIRDEDRQMLETAGVRLIVADATTAAEVEEDLAEATL
ncbi:MAG: DeoR/GlpR transcriptional regulator [Devosia sp.]|uniref:DeoR/GlpR family DNA-binding transcription regulator n=1 Tax=unclassified Devosia TaxID=196773 RepID=UPI0019ED3AFC|nr:MULTISPECIES: DeoR/GlpR family DNA-binding transcription regulator [unclassified Devosia]MBF0677977.1 DeoR/GlpR transcriptional regulator [Devosia sp.]WEJ32412.1 DeoR/GlpR family DNA-binding transcription regulator [Devosia sp. SD17-2]